MHAVSIRSGAAVALVLGAGSSPCLAVTENPCLQGEFWSIENDYFGRGKVGTDRWYTNGLHAARSFRPTCESATLRHLRAIGQQVLGREPTIMASLGMNIYTPRDIEEPGPQTSDRPWAGYSFIGIGAFTDDGRVNELADFKLGVIGPASGAEQLQKGFHRLIGDDRPAGWRNQLRPRLGLQLGYTRTVRWLDDVPALPAWAALHTHARATVGTVKTLGAVGLTLVAGERERVFGAPDEGDNLGLDFANHDSGFPSHLPSLRHWTFYTQLQVAWVAHNTLITGATFTEQPQLEIKHGVWMATLGLSYWHSPRTRLEYRIKWRSPEFSAAGPAPDDRIQRYGEIRWITDFEK